MNQEVWTLRLSLKGLAARHVDLQGTQGQELSRLAKRSILNFVQGGEIASPGHHVLPFPLARITIEERVPKAAWKLFGALEVQRTSVLPHITKHTPTTDGKMSGGWNTSELFYVVNWKILLMPSS